MKIINSSLSSPIPIRIVKGSTEDTVVIAPRGKIKLPPGFEVDPRDKLKYKLHLRYLPDSTTDAPSAAMAQPASGAVSLVSGNDPHKGVEVKVETPESTTGTDANDLAPEGNDDDYSPTDSED